MSTFTASKYRIARKHFQCRHVVQPGSSGGCFENARPAIEPKICLKVIHPGDKYLSYAPGQRTRIPICLEHSRQVGLFGPTYNCADVLTELENIQAPPST